MLYVVQRFSWKKCIKTSNLSLLSTYKFFDDLKFKKIHLIYLTIFTIELYSTQANAFFEVCNYTNVSANVAMSYRDFNQRWYTEGWFRIEPNQCQTLWTKQLINQIYYIYAKDDNQNIFDDERPSYEFCLDPVRKFKYENDGLDCPHRVVQFEC
jgi:uncharacterized membrane protein